MVLSFNDRIGLQLFASNEFVYIFVYNLWHVSVATKCVFYFDQSVSVPLEFVSYLDKLLGIHYTTVGKYNFFDQLCFY